MRRNPSETCEGEPSAAFEVLARNPVETCTGETANGKVRQANGTAARNGTRECTCDAKKYKPAYELRDGNLERAGRGTPTAVGAVNGKLGALSLGP